MKKALLCLFAAALVLLCMLAFPQTAHAASADDLTFTLNETGDGYIVSDCDHFAEGELTIPASYNGLPVTAIGDSAFYWCPSLTGITIPDSVTTIGEDAFEECSSLASVTIGNSVTSIGESAFQYCSGLTSVTIPDSVTTIGEYAFSYCDNLTSIQVEEGNPVYHSAGNCIIETETKTLVTGCQTSQIPTDGSVTTIGKGAFCGYTSLIGITIPDNITTIGEDAFLNCYNMTGITISNTVSTIGNSAFGGCSSLTDITIPDSVTTIGEFAFFWCTSLTNITIPDSVTSIGNSAFHNCTGLTSVTILDGVTDIGEYAFIGCSRLTSVTYCGTQEQWDAIEISEYNDPIISATLQFHNIENDVCTICGFGKDIPGDMNADGKMNYQDAVYLLLNTLFGETAYPLNDANADMDGNGTVNSEDAIYLLLHVMFGEANYPL